MNCGSSCGTHLQVAVVLSLCLVPAGAALAKCPENDYERIAQSGDWLDCRNWKHQEWDPGSDQCVCVDGVPTSDMSGDFVWIHNRGTALVRSASSARNTTIESPDHRVETMGPLQRIGCAMTYRPSRFGFIRASQRPGFCWVADGQGGLV